MRVPKSVSTKLLARWPETHSRILSGIQRATQTLLGVYLKRTCSRVTSASSALGVLNDYALYISTHSLIRQDFGHFRSSEKHAIENESVPKIIINNTINLCFKSAIGIFGNFKPYQFQALFDKIASV